MAAKGYYRNPAERPCFVLCTVCGRCDQRRARPYEACTSPCSGHIDPKGTIDPHTDDVCRCREGVMQMVRIKEKPGQFIQYRFKKNPFTSGTVSAEQMTQDERDWHQYVHEQREKMGDPNWNPVEVTRA